MIIWAVLVVSAIHCAISLYFLWRFRALPTYPSKASRHTFSVIVPIRNEEKTIQKLLEQIRAQDYPKELFEVIVVDDGSDDATREQLESFILKNQLIYHRLPDGVEGKKVAIEHGIEHATKDWIITTDGDCEVPSTWIQSFANTLDDQVQIIVGPVRMGATDFLGKLQSYDFSLLIGYAASLVGMGVPSMSNGANLCYRRRVFLEVGGYNGNKQIPSGDDEFLLLKVVKKYPNGVRYNNDKGAVVHTEPKTTISGLWNQRKRWLSKWSLHKNSRIFLSVLIMGIDNLLMLVGWIGIALGYFPLWLISVFLVRWLVKGACSNVVNKLLNGRTYWISALVFELLYPFYVVLLSFASIFGHYTWKGRKYT